MKITVTTPLGRSYDKYEFTDVAKVAGARDGSLGIHLKDQDALNPWFNHKSWEAFVVEEDDT